MSKFKVGDKCKIVANEASHGFEIGEEVEVVDIDNGYYPCRGIDKDGEVWNWSCSTTDLELINPTEEEKPSEVKFEDDHVLALIKELKDTIRYLGLRLGQLEAKQTEGVIFTPEQIEVILKLNRDA